MPRSMSSRVRTRWSRRAHVTRMFYAVALAERGSRREAIELLERTLAAHPDDADVRAALDAYRPTEQTD